MAILTGHTENNFTLFRRIGAQINILYKSAITSQSISVAISNKYSGPVFLKHYRFIFRRGIAHNLGLRF